ncbi:MAG TPA: hypothetical protein VFJ74_05765 [Gemmatimonadaceae bacterium]|nr:hypothetical protein [Gemmatimonadaceae bacterium]
MRQHQAGGDGGRVGAAVVAAAVLALALAVAPASASAQQRDTTRRRPSPTTQRPTTGRRSAPIEIRGTVPTPQVVTVRPRETPTYDRRVLVPNFYDHDFWASSILPGYQIVQRRALTGALPGDTTSASSAPPAAPPAAATPPAAADSTRRPPPGTAPARTLR